MSEENVKTEWNCDGSVVVRYPPGYTPKTVKVMGRDGNWWTAWQLQNENFRRKLEAFKEHGLDFLDYIEYV